MKKTIILNVLSIISAYVIVSFTASRIIGFALDKNPGNNQDNMFLLIGIILASIINIVTVINNIGDILKKKYIVWLILLSIVELHAVVWVAVFYRFVILNLNSLHG